LRKVAELGLRTRYLHETETKKKIKMLMATAFLPLPEVPAAVDLLGRNVTGLIAALFDYFRREWMTPNRLPLWNVYNVQTRTNNHLEGWHLKMNRQAGKHHLSFYELLQLLIDEQGSTETLIQQVTSGRVTANDLRIKNNKYEEVQLRITALTAEYDGGTLLRKVAELGLRTRYLHETETKKKIKMLMATAFLPLPEVPAAVDLLGRNVTGLIAALFDYFRREWMTPNRLPLWNVYNVQTRTNNHLEGWHLKMNRQAGKHHLSFYELLQLLIDEQGSTETLIQQVTSGRVTANDLRIKNNKYEEVQLRITALTAEYDGGTRTMEQFLKAVAYDVPEPINF
ncbi:hypothetical protein T06_16648, partial [Trichinella sp. T6]